MASKRRNMFQKNKTQETTENGGLRSALRDSNHVSVKTTQPLNDVSIQADLCVPEPASYESEDEAMGRRRTLGRSGKPSGTALYSKQDIREQYCITDRQLHGLEHNTTGLFGCLSSYHDSSCSSRSPSLLTVCMKGRAPSDENLAELCRRPGPMPRAAWPPPPYPPPPPSAFHFHRAIYPDPYAWLPEEEEPCRMERPRPVRGFEYDVYPRRFLSYSTEYLHGRHDSPCPAHPHLPPPPPPPTIPSVPHRQKHVSFARSHTMQSFDDTVSFGSGSCITACSQERLIDGRKSAPEQPKVIVMEKAKRAPMKTQATQTEVCLGRKPLPPNYLSLSPRSVHKVRMVSQGAQTNGDKNGNGRRLMKSYSEVGGQFAVPPPGVNTSGKLIAISNVGGSSPAVVDVASVHEPLQRTQSDEPPRSPFTPTSPKEILIDFEPLERRVRNSNNAKRTLGKTLSDGGDRLDEDKEGIEAAGGTQSDGELPSSKTTLVDQENSGKRTIEITSPNVKQLISADSQEEEFHENIIYGELYRKRSISMESTNGPTVDTGSIKSGGPSQAKSPSPFASCDSLNTKDHSDGIWNESQATVLHADSDNNGGGTGVSCSDLSSCLTPSAAINSMTPTTRRRHLLMMQHQQRSSMDTEVLDAEEPDMEVPLSPRIKAEVPTSTPLVSVTVPVQERSLDTKKLVPNHVERKTDRALSPTFKGKRRSTGTRTPESEPHHSSTATLSSNENFARSDSGKTNTDMSETSTTTDDYATATENNSEASSRPPGGGGEGSESGVGVGGGLLGSMAGGGGGGSFESGTSSLYSLTRADATEEQQVPSSPQPIEEEEVDRVSECERRSRDGESSCAESSSSGSYSVDGSSDKLHSDRSDRVSSPGGFDSPPDDNHKRSTWTEEEKLKVKKSFKLELSVKEESNENSVGTTSRPKNSVQEKAVRSPGQVGNKRTPNQVSKDVTTPGLVRSPAMHEGFRAEDWVAPQRLTPEEKRNKVSNGLRGVVDTSDESSTEECACGKAKRNRDSPRRRTSGAKSPTTLARDRRRSISEDVTKRRCSIVTKSPSPITQQQPQAEEKPAVVNSTNSLAASRLSPHNIPQSPSGSPNKKQKSKSILSPDPSRLKALSAESLRSVSPGSDSVFYSEPSSNTGTTQEKAKVAQSTCHHCGRQMDSQTQGNERSGVEIVQPPAGFADSPRTPHRTRLYKKADKRYRSEERRHHSRLHLESARAKSEERAREERREKIRPLIRSTDASMEKLHSLHSSFEEDTEEWSGVHSEAYHTATWVYISGAEELQVWLRAEARGTDHEVGVKSSVRRDSTDSTHSEREFRRRYQAITHRMVHRKSSLEMYKRLASKSFDTDKRVLVRRVSGEFGFRIHGSKPVVVSAIEPGTPAHSSGLEVGDIIISVNNNNVLDATHSEVVKLAHAGSDTLELEVARTCDSLSSNKEATQKSLISGHLYRLSPSSSKPKPMWILRYFILKVDQCLYHYKTESGGQPLGALRVTDYTFSKTPDSERPFSFRIGKKGSPSVHLAASSASEVDQWMAAFSEAFKPSFQVWLTEKCLSAPPTKIHQPDCAGTLSTLFHHRGKTWKRRFCILKDACLYFFTDINAEKATAMACLHGYRVQSSASASRRFAFELFPPEPSLMHFYFYTDTELDKKRWLAALEYSIDHWVKVG